MGLCLCYAKQKKTLRFCCCCPFDFFDSLGSIKPWHPTAIVPPLSSRCVYDLRRPEMSGLPPGMASITRPPNNIKNAQGLGRSTLASSRIYLHFGSLKDRSKLILEIIGRISQTSSKTPHYSTINDHQSKSISSTYDTTSDMMQNHRLLWYCCGKYLFIMNIQDFFRKTFPLPVLSVWHSRFQPTFSVWFSVSTAQAKSCA